MTKPVFEPWLLLADSIFQLLTGLLARLSTQDVSHLGQSPLPGVSDPCADIQCHIYTTGHVHGLHNNKDEDTRRAHHSVIYFLVRSRTVDVFRSMTGYGLPKMEFRWTKKSIVKSVQRCPPSIAQLGAWQHNPNAKTRV